MIRQIQLTDFKSFVDEKVTLAPLTVLVGANASGKSNLLEALWLLHGLSLGLSLDEALNGEAPGRNGEPWAGLRGGSREASRLGTSGFRIATQWHDHGRSFDYQLSCKTSPQAEIGQQQLSAGQGQDEQIVERSGDNIFRQPWQESPIEALGTVLRKLEWVNVHPDKMRGYGQLRRSQLGPEGANFSGALYHLCQDPEERRNVVDWLTELLAPEIVDVDFVEVTELGDVMAVFVEKGGQRVSARSLSEGTLRFLGLLLALRRAEPGSTLLIEEVDSGLHPSRIHVLMECLRSATKALDVQILATTHAPVLLQSLDETSLRDAVVFGRVEDQEGTIVRRLGDLPHFDDVVRRRDVSELFSTGWLEMAL